MLAMAAAATTVVVTILYVGDGSCGHCCCRHRSLCWRWRHHSLRWQWQLRPLLLSSPFSTLALTLIGQLHWMTHSSCWCWLAAAVVVTILHIGLVVAASVVLHIGGASYCCCRQCCPHWQLAAAAAVDIVSVQQGSCDMARRPPLLATLFYLLAKVDSLE